MKFDGKIDIAEGLSAQSRSWKNKSISWSDFVKKLKRDHKTLVTSKEYQAANKTDRSKIKDNGGYVGAYLRNGRRKPNHVVHRQLLTLDIDHAHLDFWDDFCLQYNNAAFLHITHSHTPTNPRFRLIMPLSREVSPDEYVAVARKVAGLLNIELFDNTTFETNRLMFWPATPKDIEYKYQLQDGPWIDPDNILSLYLDWRDSSLWPTAKKKIDEVKSSVDKQENPEDKKGIVGSFCRAYTVSEVIETYLNDVYLKTSEPDRYTYAKGTAAAGLVVYDDKFAYSHHGTDPSGGRLCNVFDLVRIHKFGYLDANTGTNKSQASMEELAVADIKVKKLIATENFDKAKYEFIEDESDEIDLDWMTELEVDAKGRYLSTANNINLILAKDQQLKNKFKQNTFDNKRYVSKSMPWRKLKNPEPMKNVDYSGVRNYIESIYGIAGNLKIDDALAITFEKQSYNPVLDYLNSLVWDNTPRIDSLLIEYFGADDNIYSKEAIRKMLVGAVARIYKPGTKFDLVLTLVGKEQGTGKSSFFRALGRSWFSDSFSGVLGKEAFEQLQGAWIIEMAELKGLRKAEVEAVKHFITKQDDTFRPAYARTPETFPRQNVFVATTNELEFLRDPSGNRRFMPITVSSPKVTKNKALLEFLNSPELIDCIWAEAVHLYKNKEPLYLSEEAEFIASGEQKKHSETDERAGFIETYLNTLVPSNWDDMDLFARRTFLEDPKGGTVERDYTCVAEIWAECLGNNPSDLDRYKSPPIHDILGRIDGWRRSASTKNFKLYGKQKYYARALD